MTEGNKEDLFDLFYDLPECYMITWEELMDRTSITTSGYDIWNEIPEPENNQISTNGGETVQIPRGQPNIHKWRETLQTPRKQSNIHKWGETPQTPRNKPNIHNWGETLKALRE